MEVKTQTKESDLDLAIDECRIPRVAAAEIAGSYRSAKPQDEIGIDIFLTAQRSWPLRLANDWHG
jgi:hypothetical protein